MIVMRTGRLGTIIQSNTNEQHKKMMIDRERNQDNLLHSTIGVPEV
jgi:hypothetical protein